MREILYVVCIVQGGCAPSLTTHLGVSSQHTRTLCLHSLASRCSNVIVPSLFLVPSHRCDKPWRLCFTLFAFGNSEPVDRNVNVTSSSTTYYYSYWYLYRNPLLVLPGKDLIGHINSINLHHFQLSRCLNINTIFNILKVWESASGIWAQIHFGSKTYTISKSALFTFHNEILPLLLINLQIPTKDTYRISSFTFPISIPIFDISS